MLKKILLLGFMPFNHACNIHLIPLLADRIGHLGYNGCYNVRIARNMYSTLHITFPGAIFKKIKNYCNQFT